MKVISTKKLKYDADRAGIKEDFIIIDLVIEKRDEVKQTVTLKATDSVILNKGEVDLKGRSLERVKRIEVKRYNYTYEEYETQKAYFLGLDESGLTGVALEDKLLQDALLHNLTIDPIYYAEGSDWARA